VRTHSPSLGAPRGERAWKPAAAGTTLDFMETPNPAPGERTHPLRPETEAEKQRRFAREADARDPAGAERRRRLTLDGLADVDAGRLIDDEAMEAWVESLGSDQELPLPQPD